MQLTRVLVKRKAKKTKKKSEGTRLDQSTDVKQFSGALDMGHEALV